ncbi:MAG: hypothetical protein ABJA74_13680 [Lapillicoccus sp.]
MTRSATSRPVLGLVVLLLAFAVVVMHQMGVGHQAMAAGSGASAVHATAASASDMLDGHRSSAAISEAVSSGCVTGCPVGDVHEAPLAGPGASMVCLAVLPLLLLWLRRRRVLLTRWLRVIVDTHAVRSVGSWWTTGAGPPEPSLVRLCVSRT